MKCQNWQFGNLIMTETKNRRGAVRLFIGRPRAGFLFRSGGQTAWAVGAAAAGCPGGAAAGCPGAGAGGSGQKSASIPAWTWAEFTTQMLWTRNFMIASFRIAVSLRLITSPI